MNPSTADSNECDDTTERILKFCHLLNDDRQNQNRMNFQIGMVWLLNLYTVCKPDVSKLYEVLDIVKMFFGPEKFCKYLDDCKELITSHIKNVDYIISLGKSA